MAKKKYFSEPDSALMKTLGKNIPERAKQKECFQKLSPEAIEFLRSELKKEYVSSLERGDEEKTNDIIKLLHNNACQLD